MKSLLTIAQLNRVNSLPYLAVSNVLFYRNSNFSGAADRRGGHWSYPDFRYFTNVKLEFFT